MTRKKITVITLLKYLKVKIFAFSLKKVFLNVIDLPVFQTLLLDSCVIWGKSLKLSVPQFAHLQSGNENSTYLLELMRGLMT